MLTQVAASPSMGRSAKSSLILTHAFSITITSLVSCHYAMNNSYREHSVFFVNRVLINLPGLVKLNSYGYILIN